MGRKCLLLLLVFTIMAITPVSAATRGKVPDPLKPWVDWVLQDHQEELLCTANYNDARTFNCNWPAALNLDIKATRGTFSQSWRIEHESWVQLPGNEQLWPQAVSINGQPAIVLNRNNVPQVKLPAGNATISGSFSWQSIPEFLQIDPGTALLSLKINGQTTDFPSLDDAGRVWLHARQQAEKTIENSLQLKAFRMIDDRIPARLILLLNLDVAGAAREVLLGSPFPATSFVPLSLNSSLPARLEKDGRIRIQLRPGQWQITLTARHIGPLASLKFSRPDDEFWPDQEIWVFAKQDNRIVEIRGVPPIDPQQTTLPPDWQNMPAYRLLAGEEMTFKTIKRGDPVPAPDQLNLQRNLWLRFDGSGYTIQDRITGKKTSDWRLEMAPPITLGRVAVDGAEQFITRMADSENAGIELRNGLINISADSTYQGGIGRIPAIGWQHDLQKVSANLFLPPGYRLLHATGIDNIPATWLNRWTLLDIFVLLIFTVALAKLYARPLAMVGFITMALLYHEPGSPRWIWLAILIGVTLIRTIPPGRFLQAVKIYHHLAFLLLIIIAIPFTIKQLQTGFYPQLERPWQVMGSNQMPLPAAPETAIQSGMRPESDLMRQSVENFTEMGERTVSKFAEKTLAITGGSNYYRQNQVAQYDPAMINQTGPGIPAWQWTVIPMSWSGPVKADQQIGLTLIGPRINLALAFARVALMILLAAGLLGISYRRAAGWQFPDPKKLLIVTLLLLPLFSATPSRATDIPSPALFEELQQRLLEKNDCFPDCADIPAMTIDLDQKELVIELNVMSQLQTAIPLPGNPGHWLADTVKVDASPADALYRTGQGLWLIVPEGRHQVTMQGKVPPNNTLQLSLPLKPHQLQIKQQGWTTEGTHRDGSIDNQLHFKRIVEQNHEADLILETGILPPFVQVDRVLQLGLEWRIVTTISRISPPGSAIILEYPLLAGEAVVSGSIKVKDGKVQINLDPDHNYLQFESILARTGEINLRHLVTDNWTETWQVDASPIFHLEYEGIPVILHQVGNHWTPKWHPWPGEELRLVITRPAGVTGQSITIDKSRLEISPGQRATDLKLELSLRSSQGGHHPITLPPDSRLQEVLINGRVQSIRQEGQLVPLPIVPGRQEITLKWRGAAGITTSYETPVIDLALGNANTSIDLHIPDNRWPLLVCGPIIGPAILYWSVVLVIILVAFGLARSGLVHLKFYQLLLLGIGMSQSNLLGCLLVVGWLIAVNYRRKLPPKIDHSTFNAIQAGLGLLTIMAIGALIFAISQGLLSQPNMNIVGNGSGRNLLRWYQDYSSGPLPRAWLLSIPMFWYRLAMLAWALWISFTLLGILRFGWQAMVEPVLWYPTGPIRKLRSAAKIEPAAEAEIDLTAEMEVETGEKEQE